MTLLLKTNRFLVTVQFWGFISVETLRLCTNIQNQQERSCSVLIMSLSSAARWTGFFLKTLTIILLIPHILLQLVCQKFLKLSVFLFKLLRAFKWILEPLFFNILIIIATPHEFTVMLTSSDADSGDIRLLLKRTCSRTQRHQPVLLFVPSRLVLFPRCLPVHQRPSSWPPAQRRCGRLLWLPGTLFGQR